jgi:hypothetical protein
LKAARSPAERLLELAKLRDSGLVTEAEFEAKRPSIVADL